MNKARILIGDVRETLRTLPDGTVQCCVTSPPYWNLRNYGCEGQLGLEATPDEYVANMVAVFREVRRCLRDDGTLWLNLGDSYTSGGRDSFGPGTNRGQPKDAKRAPQPPDLKPKDLCMIPWRVAIALQADGWWLRSVICWAKKSPMPESVGDRPTNSWEPIFLLAKSSRYYYDAESVKEKSTEYERTPDRTRVDPGKHKGISNEFIDGVSQCGVASTRNQRNVWWLGPEPFREAHFAVFPSEIPRRAILAGTSERGACPTCGAPWERIVERGEYTKSNQPSTRKQSEINPQAHKGANSIMGKVGGGYVPTATTGWRPTCDCDGIDRRIVSSPTGGRAGDDPSMETGRAGMNRPRGDNEGQRPMTRHEQARYADQLKNSPHRSEMREEAGETAFAHYLRTDDNGARPIPADLLDKWISCGWIQPVIVPNAEDLPTVPCVVLDPFGGSGTTGVVAMELGRDAILCELNPDYAAMAQRRIDGVDAEYALFTGGNDNAPPD